MQINLEFDYMRENMRVANVQVINSKVYLQLFTTRFFDNPLGIREIYTLNDIYEFFEYRCVPKNRANIKEILEDMNLSEYNPIGIIKVTHGVLTDDCYWIKFKGEDLSWEKDIYPIRYPQEIKWISD